MPKTDERIEALQKSLEESRKLYDDTKIQYKVALATYEQAKIAVFQTEYFASILNNASLDPASALKTATSFVPNPQEYAARVNQPGADPQKLKQELLNENKKQANVAEAVEKKAKKEVQQISKAIEGIDNQISVILNQLGIATSGITLKKKAEVAEKANKVKVKSRTKKIKLNSALIDAQAKRAAITAVAKSAALFIISKLLNREVQRLSKTVQQLAELVDKVNDQIESIQTKQDVLKARITRDAALVQLGSAKRQIKNVRDIIKTLETLLTILSLAAKVAITFIQIPTTPLIVQKIVNLILTIDSITIILGTTKSALNDLIIELEYQESILLPISDIIDKALDENLTPDEIANLLGNIGNIDNLAIPPYRGFTFKIYEENNPKNVVAGNTRKYAVALDRSGFIRLRSQASFTLNPSVLIEELKLQIDEQNLES